MKAVGLLALAVTISGCAAGDIGTGVLDGFSTDMAGNITAECSDGVRDGDETDVDCGGRYCAKCGPTRACVNSSDCANSTCTNKKCVDTGLVGYWRFEDPGSSAIDLSGHGNNGTVNNATSVAGRVGKGLQFSSGNVTIASSNSLNLSTQMTLSAWFTADTPSPLQAGLLMKTSSSNWDDGYGIYETGGLTLCAYVQAYNKNDTPCFPIDFSMPLVYHHVAATYDGSILTLYIDGARLSTQSITGGISQNGGALLIGSAPDGYNWKGKIDEVQIYNRALASTDVMALYMAP